MLEGTYRIAFGTNFSKLGFIVIVCVGYSSELTFENFFCQLLGGTYLIAFASHFLQVICYFRMFLYIYVNVSLHMCKDIYVKKHTFWHIYICTYVYTHTVCVCVCVCVWVGACLCVTFHVKLEYIYMNMYVNI